MDAVELAYSKNRAFHTSELRHFGPRTEVLWKGGPKSQRDRFDQIVRILPDLSGTSVLDVGCGFGDFHAYLVQAGFQDIRYCGIDICREMIEECRRRHPDQEFHECGILEYEPTAPRFDFSVASGIFFMPSPDWESYVAKTVKSMFNVSRVGLAVNFLSSYSKAPSEESYYAQPGRTLELLMHNVTPWAVLAHDYRWNDFTIGLFHHPQARS
jgi:SAM-dependent methyltransferase